MILRAGQVSPRGVDVMLLVAVAGSVSVAVAADQASSRPVDPLPYLWAAGLGALMMLRRQTPALVLAMTAIGFFTYYAAGFPAIGVAVPIAAALYSAAEARRTFAAVVTGAVALLASTCYRLASGQSIAFVLGYELVSHAALIAAVIALGDGVRARRELAERGRTVAELTARESTLQAEANARRQRLGLARDLHDSLGHALSVAALFLGAARDKYGVTSAAGEDPLNRARTAVIEAMAHLRSTVSLLRSPGDQPSVPTLDDLPAVLQSPRLAGVDVDVRMDHGLRAEPEVQHVVYRLVQEAVTNSLKHSDASCIRVDIGSDGRGNLTVDVIDDGTSWSGSAAVPPYGNGLEGMRERVHAVSGVLEISVDNGWRVSASLPAGGSDDSRTAGR